MQVFSCEFCEISKNTFSYRIPLVAASDKKSSLQDTYFLKGGSISLFILTKFGEKSQTTIILGNFINQP